MPQLKLFLFGSPRIELNGISADTPRRKVMALLVYLAVTQQPQRRDALVTLFWPESSQKAARASLRRELHALIQSIGEGWLNTTRETIELNPDANVWVDAEEFQRLVKETGIDTGIDALTGAIDLYQGDFLAGFTLTDCPEFDDWQFFEADGLRRSYAWMLETLVRSYEKEQKYESAISYARRWLGLDAMHEPVHRELMRLFALAGQQAAALRQYDECVRILNEELGVPPEEETTALFEAIRTRQSVNKPALSGAEGASKDGTRHPTPHSSTQPVTSLLPHSPTPSPTHNLPSPSNSFIGRDDEVAAIRQILIEQTDCKLLTLIGPGGIGKTRLAVEVALDLIDAFPDGVHFVGLASVIAVENIASAVAEAIHFSFSGTVEPEVQLTNYLHTRQLLLVVDNMEHLLDGVEILSNLVSAATKIKIIATSREALGLQEEWLYPLDGMAVPTNKDPVEKVEKNGAVQLFTQRARRTDATFALNQENMHSVTRICQLVDGMPLGIELAAAWMSTMPCHEIVAEIEESIDILATSLRNVPERHRSLRAVFQQTWGRLTEREQATLQKLAVFRGPFSREAAQEIADATLLDISSLVNKSLCRRDAKRYVMHELLRQFAFEQIDEDKQQIARTQHSRYFGALLEAQQQQVMTSAEDDMLLVIADAFDNILAGWRFLLEQIQAGHEANRYASLMDHYVPALAVYFDRRSLFWDGQRIFQQAIDTITNVIAEQLEEYTVVNQLHHHLQVEQAYLIMHLGRHKEANTKLLALLPHLCGHASEGQLADALTYLGRSFRHVGGHKEAEEHLLEAIALYERLGLRLKSTMPLIELGAVKFDHALYGEDQAYTTKALALFEEAGYIAGVANCMNSIGITYEWTGDIQQAMRCYERGYKLVRTSNNRLLIGILLSKLGSCAYKTDNTDEALEKYAASIAIFRELGEMRWLSDVLLEIAIIQINLLDLVTATEILLEALRIVQQYHNMIIGVRALATVALLLERTHHYGLAVAIGSHVSEDVLLHNFFRDYCDRILSELAVKMEPSIYAEAQARGRSASFEVMIEEAIYALDHHHRQVPNTKNA